MCTNRLREPRGTPNESVVLKIRLLFEKLTFVHGIRCSVTKATFEQAILAPAGSFGRQRSRALDIARCGPDCPPEKLLHTPHTINVRGKV